MSRDFDTPTSARAAPAPRLDRHRGPILPLVGAAAFLLFYLAVSPVAGPLQGRSIPLPGAPQDQVYAYLVSSTGASFATGVLQGLSVLGLAVVLVSPVRKVDRDEPTSRPRVVATVAGGIAVLAMLITVTLSIVLGVSASTASPGTLVALRNAAFIAGGVVHVVALGVFVLLVSRAPRWSRSVRVFGLVAAIPAILSVASTLWFYASVLLPVGRLLCMAWLVIAAISLPRPDRRRRMIPDRDRPPEVDAARTGIFWAGVSGRLPKLPAARTLGFQLIEADTERGTITVQFDGAEAFTNPKGEVLGGFLAAMLYDTVGPALLATLPAGWFIETDNLAVVFRAPAATGRLTGYGHVLSRHTRSSELAGELVDRHGTLVATATATARIVPWPPPERDRVLRRPPPEEG